jgi:hypothetical protein
VLALLVAACGPAIAGVAEPVVVKGAQRVLVIPVRFPGTLPSTSLAEIKDKVGRVGRYIRVASYDKAWLQADVTDWQQMAAPLSSYKVSPFNYADC